jgi:uncharacterized coiled-coil protein SlyX
MSDWLHDWWAQIAFTLLLFFGGAKWVSKTERRITAVESAHASIQKLAEAVAQLNVTVAKFTTKVDLLFEGKVRLDGDNDHAAS